MRKIVTFCVLFAIAAITGCTTVSSEKPVGEKPAAIKRAEWEGKWLCDGQWCSIRVLDEAKGLLEITIPGHGKEDKGEVIEVRLWQFENRLIFNVPLAKTDAGEQTDGPPYQWGLVKKNDDEIVAWPPNDEKMEALIAEGKLEGKVTDAGDHGRTVSTKEVPSGQLKALLPVEAAGFDWEKPIVLLREKQKEAQPPAGK